MTIFILVICAKKCRKFEAETVNDFFPFIDHYKKKKNLKTFYYYRGQKLHEKSTKETEYHRI